MLQNNTFAVILQDAQISFRQTTTPMTPPVRRTPCFSKIARFLEPILQTSLLPELFTISNLA